MTISGIRVIGDFSQTNKCGSVLAPGAICTVSVTFTPTRPGVRAGTLTITDGNGSHARTVLLSGSSE